MNRLPLALVLAFSCAATVLAADFIETVSGQAPLQGDNADACQKAAEQQLIEPRAKLQKQCEEAGGQFNMGLATPSLHRTSCSVYQTVTCSGTGAPAQTEAQKPSDADKAEPASKPESETLPTGPAKSKTKKKLKKRAGDRQAAKTEKPAAGR